VSDVATPDGRTLSVTEGGDPNGKPVLVHNGTPGSGLLYPKHETLAREQGIRLIGYSRPGYDGSTRQPGRSVVDCVGDVNAIADALDLERYVSWGISGGGPHVLACAALCDERLVAVASLASVAPYEAEGLDWLAGMGESNIAEFGAAVQGESALRPYLEQDAAGLEQATPETLTDAWASLLGPEDRAVASDELARYLLDCMSHGLAPGVDGWLDDDLAFAKPWGFDLAAISRPVLLLQGEDDRFVPPSHGHWLADRVPGVETRITTNDGHLTLGERRVPEAQDWLLRHL
jgi:pimeloyl-ACP methyl ester carboxylesterase